MPRIDIDSFLEAVVHAAKASKAGRPAGHDGVAGAGLLRAHLHSATFVGTTLHL